MSWKGAVRSIVATSRRIERDNQRRARVAAQNYKQLQKQEAILDAAQAVRSYTEYVASITSVHLDCSDSIDWVAIQQEPPPLMPSLGTEHESTAQIRLDTCQPNFFDRFLNRGPVKMHRLEEALHAARQRDQ